MCKITSTLYTCKHEIERTLSSCLGQVKAAPDSSIPACRKNPSMYFRATHKCGPCSRLDAVEEIYRDLGLTREQDLTEQQQTTFDERFAEVMRTIPTDDRRIAPIVYSRRPSRSRLMTRRRGSLLRQEVKAEDVSGPEAWGSDSDEASEGLKPVHETVCSGWGLEWTSETKSLTEELAENAAERGAEVEGDQDEDDQNEDDQDEDDQDEDDQDEDDQDEDDQDEDGQDEDGQDEEDQDGSEEGESGDEELGVYEGDDLLLLAQQTPLPLDLEVSDRDDHYTECDPSPPTTAVDTLMPAQHDIISSDGANTNPSIALDTASSELTAENLRVLDSYSQSARSPKGNNTPSNLSRVKTLNCRAWQLAGDSKVRYWYRQHKSSSPDNKTTVGCWELVSVTSS